MYRIQYKDFCYNLIKTNTVVVVFVIFQNMEYATFHYTNFWRATYVGTTVFRSTQNFEPSSGILQNSVLANNKGYKYGTFWSFSGDFAMKYMTAAWAITEGMLKLLI